MPKAAKQLMSLDEFLAWERKQPECYEYAGGVATMVTGGSLDHSTIASNLRTQVRGDEDTVLEPVLVIEVISPSTEREDRGRKKFDYFATASIGQYAIIV